jgi:uncharacterized membrane protein
MFGRDDKFMQNNGRNISGGLTLGIIGFITFLVFLILKVTGSWTDISWFWVFFPLWITWAFDLVLFLIFLVIFLVWYKKD